MGEQLSDLEKLGPNIMGELWSDQGLTDIKEISISHCPGVIRTFCVVYGGPDGDIIKEHGVRHKRHTHTHIPFAPDEFPTRIYGYYKLTAAGNPAQVATVGIETNKASYGPFGGGVNEDEFYSWDVGSNRFRGFHGSVLNGTLVGLGVFVKKYISTSKNIELCHRSATTPVSTRKSQRTRKNTA